MFANIKSIAAVLIEIILLCGVYSCTKQKGTNPALRYSDQALLDSCKSTEHHYYKNSSALLPATGPHGEHTLRFNSVALKALTDNGQLPKGAKMPEGAMVIKDMYSGGSVFLYALMYKKSGQWLWAEIKPSGEVVYSVTKDPEGCTGCHSGPGNRDLILSFK